MSHELPSFLIDAGELLQHVSRVVNVFHTSKDYERKKNKHQEISKTHLPVKCLPCTDKHNPHRCQF